MLSTRCTCSSSRPALPPLVVTQPENSHSNRRKKTGGGRHHSPVTCSFSGSVNLPCALRSIATNNSIVASVTPERRCRKRQGGEGLSSLSIKEPDRRWYFSVKRVVGEADLIREFLVLRRIMAYFDLRYISRETYQQSMKGQPQ